MPLDDLRCYRQPEAGAASLAAPRLVEPPEALEDLLRPGRGCWR